LPTSTRSVTSLKNRIGELTHGGCAGALGVSRGGFYAWLTQPRSQRSHSDEELGAKVRTSFLGSDRTYGARGVWHDVRRASYLRREVMERVPLSNPTIWKLMQNGESPRSRDIGRKVVWLESEIDDWIESRPVVKLKGDGMKGDEKSKRSSKKKPTSRDNDGVRSKRTGVTASRQLLKR
jgi:predicted DNA-binding transcriptional regulator AlpA